MACTTLAPSQPLERSESPSGIHAWQRPLGNDLPGSDGLVGPFCGEVASLTSDVGNECAIARSTPRQGDLPEDLEALHRQAVGSAGSSALTTGAWPTATSSLAFGCVGEYDDDTGGSDAGASAGSIDGEKSAGEDSEDTEGLGSEPSDEEEENVCADDEIYSLSLAQVEPAPEDDAAPAAEASAPATPASGYPHQNLPPKTGISVPMLAEPPSFIRAVPAEPELLYVAPDNVFDDIVKSEADRISRPENVRNRTVFDSVEARPPQPPTAAEGSPSAGAPGEMAETLAPYYTPTGSDDTTLVFESRFESGNLRRAVQVYEFEYDLVLNPDYNTKSHTQWYHFRVGNTRKGPSYRFNVLNMQKPTSVYNDGMRPLQYSSIRAAIHGEGWVRCGTNIAYYQNGVRRKDKGGCSYYTLTWTVTFEHDCDLVYFSHCYPYSYTDLQKDLLELEKDPHVSRRFRRRKLCETLAGNPCDLITITSFSSDPDALRNRRAIVITARVHPGESNASWVMKGMLDYLTGPSLDARILRDNFVFKIIPMLNPDGVIVGNYRCSLAGQDLNRLWDDPSRKMHPTIFFAKTMIRHLLNDREVVLYIDIHGHSRKKNVFMYGNSESSGSGVQQKIFPGLLCRSSQCFCFDDCCFKMQKCKESTARVVAYRELAIVNSFTLEASFCGADFGSLADQHFTTKHLEEMGYMLCDAILDFCDPDQTKVMQVVKELQLLYPDDGNSDDVSDSEDDGAAAARARRRKQKGSKVKKEKSRKKPTKSRSGVNDLEGNGHGDREVHTERSGTKGSTRRPPRDGASREANDQHRRARKKQPKRKDKSGAADAGGPSSSSHPSSRNVAATPQAHASNTQASSSQSELRGRDRRQQQR